MSAKGWGMVDRKSTSVWEGDLKSGQGTTSFDSSGAVEPVKVTWPARSEDPGGKTSPEELIAAAHASCFNMALSGALARGGHDPEQLETSAVVTFSTDGGAHIAGVALTVRGTVPGISEEDFKAAAEQAKDGCPVSKALTGNVAITLDAALASAPA